MLSCHSMPVAAIPFVALEGLLSAFIVKIFGLQQHYFPLSKDYRLIDRLHQNESGSILGYCAEYSISAHVAKVPFPEFLG